jgi:plasmid stabilization system protein ParE
MKVELYASFIRQLDAQTRYIARDKPSAARRFKQDVLKRAKALSESPYAHRRSNYFDGPEYRDLVFRGYKVIFRIDEERDTIYVIGLVNMQKGPSDL